MTNQSNGKVLADARAEMLEYARAFRIRFPEVTQEQLEEVLRERFVNGKNPLGFAAGVRITGVLLRLPVALDDMAMIFAEQPVAVAESIKEVAETVVQVAPGDNKNQAG